MRCKVGDLAVVVHSTRGNEGCVVTVAKWLGDVETIRAGIIPNCWGVLGRIRNQQPNSAAWSEAHAVDGWFADTSLRPIRDNDGQDETLTWKQKETA